MKALLVLILLLPFALQAKKAPVILEEDQLEEKQPAPRKENRVVTKEDPVELLDALKLPPKEAKQEKKEVVKQDEPTRKRAPRARAQSERQKAKP